MQFYANKCVRRLRRVRVESWLRGAIAIEDGATAPKSHY